MSNLIASKYFGSTKPESRRMHLRFPLFYAGLLSVLLCWPSGTTVWAQSSNLFSGGKSHGKSQLDSYNALLRDVHPASQAQANYLQNRLFLTGLMKSEQVERQERRAMYTEMQWIKKLENYDRVTRRLSAGSTSPTDLTSFCVLVSIFGDRAEVYDALSMEVLPIPHDQFMPTSGIMKIVRPDGELERPPLSLEGADGLDASIIQSAWRSLSSDLRANGRPSARGAGNYRDSVAAYRKNAERAITDGMPLSGRLQAQAYLRSLGALADALDRPQQCGQIQRYLEPGGYSYHGGSILGLMQHMVQNQVTPVQASTAQIALSELARPISRVLEQELALPYKRIDSLAADEGHRPYASEYRRHEEPAFEGMPGTQITQSATPNAAATQTGHTTLEKAQKQIGLYEQH